MTLPNDEEESGEPVTWEPDADDLEFEPVEDSEEP
mgnify:CR=1 FL=1